MTVALPRLGARRDRSGSPHTVVWPRVATRSPEIAALRRMVLVRRLVVSTVVIALLVIGVTDLRGRAEVAQTNRTEAAASTYLTNLDLNVTLTHANTGDQRGRVSYYQGQIIQNRQAVASADSQTQGAEAGIRVDSFALSVLDGCLSGVTQALDQIAVGQTAGGLASLQAVGSLCQSLSP